eukprot:gene12175-5665_t
MSEGIYFQLSYAIVFDENRKEAHDIMKNNNLLPDKKKDEFFDTFYTSFSNSGIGTNDDLVKEFYETFKKSFLPIVSTSDFNVEISIKTQSKKRMETVRKYITNNTDLDFFFTRILGQFMKQYPNIEKRKPSDIFPTIRVIETYYTDRKLVPNEFEHTFIPDEVKIHFKYNTEFLKDIKIKAKVIWDDKKEDIIEDDEVWSNFEKFLSFYFGEGKPPIKMPDLEEGLKKTKESLIESDQVVNKIKSKMVSLSVSSIKKRQFPRGIIFHGPPGTGKTTLIMYLCKHLKLKMLTNPLTAGDFEQGIVGDSAKMINHLGERALAVPWQIYILAIDEVEALVKSRDSQKGDASIISVILGLLTGCKDIPNLIVFCATNHIEMIDLAFLRRMDIKCFVGKPTYEGRKQWIMKSLKSGDLKFSNLQTQELVIEMTLNFSHDAMMKLLKDLKFNSIYEGKKGEAIEADYAKKFILSVCQSDNIIFGQYYLPNLIKNNNKLAISRLNLSLKQEDAFSGKIFIDMNSSLQMETFAVLPETDQGASSIIRKFINNDKLMSTEDIISLVSLGITLDNPMFDMKEFAHRMERGLMTDEFIINEYQQLMKSELYYKYLRDDVSTKEMPIAGCKISKENVLSSLIQFGRLNKFHVVYFVDSNTFHVENRFSSESQQQYIQALHKECGEYKSSMIIYDLDSIAEISKSYSGFKSDITQYFGKSSGGMSAPNFSYHVGKQEVINMILTKFTSLSMDNLKKCWIVLLVKHPYLKKMIKDAGFPLTDEEQEIVKIENQNPMRICDICYQEFNIKENKTRKCKKHRLEKFIFQSNDHTITKETIYTLDQMQRLVDAAEKSGELKYFQQNVRYVCCGGGRYSQGCVDCNHSCKNEKIVETTKKEVPSNYFPYPIQQIRSTPKKPEESIESNPVEMQGYASDLSSIQERYESISQKSMSKEQTYLVLDMIEKNMTEDEILERLVQLAYDNF